MERNITRGVADISATTKKHSVRIVEKNLYVLREKGSNKALNVSYSPEGLQYTMNKTGRYIYNPEKNFVEKFEPKQFKNPFLQKCEVTWIMKALHL